MLETEGKKKNGINYKTSSCVKCFTVYRALSHGVMKSREKETPGKEIRQLDLRFISFLKSRKLWRRGENALLL